MREASPALGRWGVNLPTLNFNVLLTPKLVRTRGQTKDGHFPLSLHRAQLGAHTNSSLQNRGPYYPQLYSRPAPCYGRRKDPTPGRRSNPILLWGTFRGPHLSKWHPLCLAVWAHISGLILGISSVLPSPTSKTSLLRSLHVPHVLRHHI